MTRSQELKEIYKVFDPWSRILWALVKDGFSEEQANRLMDSAWMRAAQSTQAVTHNS